MIGLKKSVVVLVLGLSVSGFGDSYVYNSSEDWTFFDASADIIITGGSWMYGVAILKDTFTPLRYIGFSTAELFAIAQAESAAGRFFLDIEIAAGYYPSVLDPFDDNDGDGIPFFADGDDFDATVGEPVGQVYIYLEREVTAAENAVGERMREWRTDSIYQGEWYFSSTIGYVDIWGHQDSDGNLHQLYADDPIPGPDDLDPSEPLDPTDPVDPTDPELGGTNGFALLQIEETLVHLDVIVSNIQTGLSERLDMDMTELSAHQVINTDDIIWAVDESTAAVESSSDTLSNIDTSIADLAVHGILNAGEVVGAVNQSTIAIGYGNQTLGSINAGIGELSHMATAAGGGLIIEDMAEDLIGEAELLDEPDLDSSDATAMYQFVSDWLGKFFTLELPVNLGKRSTFQFNLPEINVDGVDILPDSIDLDLELFKNVELIRSVITGVLHVGCIFLCGRILKEAW